MLFCRKVPLPPGAHPRASDEIMTRRPSQPLDGSPTLLALSDHVEERCSPDPQLHGYWSTARVPGTPIGCGGRSRERGSGMASQEGRGGQKVKGSSAAAGSWSPGERTTGRRQAGCCCARTDAAASGGRGPESWLPLPLLPPRGCCSRLEPLHCRAYELYQVRPPQALESECGAAETATRGA